MTRTVTVSHSGGTRSASVSSGRGTNLSVSRTAAAVTVTSDTGADAEIAVVDASNAGVVPASGGGIINFLRADGTWASPPGGGGADDQTAAEVPFTPAGGLAATDVQAALEELDSEKAAASHTHSPAAINFSATARILGRSTAGAGTGEELTGTQATALLDSFTSALKGLAPASGGGTANYLRADGTWATPSSSDTVVYPEDHGAVGDGVTNDTTAVQTALAAAATAGKRLEFKAKSYAILGVVVTPTGPLHITGAPGHRLVPAVANYDGGSTESRAGITIKHFSDVTIDGLNFVCGPKTDVAATAQNFRFSLRIIGDDAGQAQIRRVRIRNCRVWGGYAGLYVSHAGAVFIHDNVVEWTETWGISVVGWSREAICRHNTVRHVAMGEAIKRGDNETNTSTDWICEGNIMFACGSLDYPNFVNDTYDTHLHSSGRNICRGNILMYCDTGGISGKRSNQSANMNQRTDDIIVGNYVHMMHGRGIASQWAAVGTTSDMRFERFDITDNIVFFDYYSRRELSVTNIATTNNSYTVVITCNAHQFAARDKIWLYSLTNTSIGGVPATSLLTPLEIISVTTNTITVTVDSKATSTVSQAVTAKLRGWQHVPTTLGTNPVTTTTGSGTVTITMTAHGLSTTSVVDIAGATTAGTATAAQINGRHLVTTVPTADTFTVAIPTVTTGGTGGGSAVTVMRHLSTSGDDVGARLDGVNNSLMKDNRVYNAKVGYDFNRVWSTADDPVISSETEMVCAGNYALGTATGVRIYGGTMTKFTGEDNILSCFISCLALEAGVTSVSELTWRNNKEDHSICRKSSNPSRYIRGLQTALFEGNHTKTTGYSMRIGLPTGGALSGRIVVRNNAVETVGDSQQQSIRVDASTLNGDLEVHDNDHRLSTTRGTFFTLDASVTGFVKAYNNMRGYSAAKPTWTASFGDISRTSAITAGAYPEWIYTGSAWKGRGILEA